MCTSVFQTSLIRLRHLRETRCPPRTRLVVKGRTNVAAVLVAAAMMPTLKAAEETPMITVYEAAGLKDQPDDVLAVSACMDSAGSVSTLKR